MSYNLIFVDVGYANRIPTTVHRMNVITGDYLMPIYLKQDNIIEQIDALTDIILRDRPDKIIFDKFGNTVAFYDYFMRRANGYHRYNKGEVSLNIDAFGLITYGDE